MVAQSKLQAKNQIRKRREPGGIVPVMGWRSSLTAPAIEEALHHDD
jgi:hypothetical protein